MSDSRKKMLEKVKAILSKTMENGCTEGEAGWFWWIKIVEIDRFV